MVQHELGIIENGNFVKTDIKATHCRNYSDSGSIIIQVETNAEYDIEAIDVLPCKYTYIESDKEIEVEQIFEEN